MTAKNREPQPTLAMAATRMGIVPPAVRTFGTHRYRWALLLLPVLGAIAALLIARIATTEGALREQGGDATRVVAHELRPGSRIVFPLEPRTTSMRLWLSAAAPVPGDPPRARLTVTRRGAGAPLVTTHEVELTSTAARVTPEERGLVVGDPRALDVSAGSHGPGEMEIRLDAVDRARSVTVRALRREELSEVDAERRTRNLSRDELERLAENTWAKSFFDLSKGERDLALRRRLEKVGPLPSSDRLVEIAMALGHASQEPVAHDPKPFVLRDRIGGSSRTAFLAEGGIVELSAAEPRALLTARVRTDETPASVYEHEGTLTLALAEGQQSGVEVAANIPTEIVVRSTHPERILRAKAVPVYRIGPGAPLRLSRADEQALVRVAVRRPLPAGAAGRAEVGLSVTLSANGKPPMTTKAVASAFASPFDRYDGDDHVPTEATYFYLVVPPRHEAVVASDEGEVDVSLGEFDPESPPLDAIGHRRGPPSARLRTIGVSTASVFFHRLPSHADPTRVRTLRIAPRFVVDEASSDDAPDIRVARPEGFPAKVIDGRTFETGKALFHVATERGRHVTLPVRIVTDVPTVVTITVDETAGTPKRHAGMSKSFTTNRRYNLAAGESYVGFPLGDDLAPGDHVVRVRSERDVWVHLPWQSRRSKLARWTSGDFDE